MGTIPWPEDAPDTWDTLLLAGTIFPGLAKVTCTGGHKIDVKDAPGADGESTTLQGEKVKSGSILIRVWQAQQWSDLEDLVTTVLEPVKGKKEPVFMAHAVTAARNVANVLIEEVEGPIFTDERWMEVKCKWRQFKPPPPKPKPVTKTPTKPKDKADPSTVPDDPAAPSGGGAARRNKRNASTADPTSVPKNPKPSATPSFGEIQ